VTPPEFLFSVRLVKNGGSSFWTRFKGFVNQRGKTFLNRGYSMKDRMVQPIKLAIFLIYLMQSLLCDTERLS